MSLFNVEEYFGRMFDRLRLDVEGRRREDRALNRFSGTIIIRVDDELNDGTGVSFNILSSVVVSSVPKPSKSTLVVDKVYFYAKNNATEHRTVRYELVHRQPETAILRRGQAFTFIIRFADGKSFNPEKDLLRLHFNLGEVPSLFQLLLPSGTVPPPPSISFIVVFLSFELGQVRRPAL